MAQTPFRAEFQRVPASSVKLFHKVPYIVSIFDCIHLLISKLNLLFDSACLKRRFSLSLSAFAANPRTALAYQHLCDKRLPFVRPFVRLDYITERVALLSTTSISIRTNRTFFTSFIRTAGVLNLDKRRKVIYRI